MGGVVTDCRLMRVRKTTYQSGKVVEEIIGIDAIPKGTAMSIAEALARQFITPEMLEGDWKVATVTSRQILQSS